LTFYNEALEDVNKAGRGFRSRDQSFVKEKELLEKLVEKRSRKDQRICLLHGPGSSGKTTVIDLIMEYSREYCSYMDNYEFTSRTIIVTAMTRGAATLLLGETTHSAVYLNQKRPIEANQVDCWAETRMLIIDKISFAAKEDLENCTKSNIRRLKQQLHLPCGGLSIVFAGDFRQLEPVGEQKPV
jgi:uncharacterized protein with HEPN domain